eukprot:gnl/Spiro4/26782_TR13307_c0_g1_i1.p1 gnl/Spiro4/26782_TR13307_c0_g1~~gnl/Spiro4/26782_TR13307_c0_g1_i1.p1  ORF type:complete len:158 (+),score=14.66 gnl/Spiro4/26782_TR13307_c0_g1_i1:83-556(+)
MAFVLNIDKDQSSMSEARLQRLLHILSVHLPQMCPDYLRQVVRDPLSTCLCVLSSDLHVKGGLVFKVHQVSRFIELVVVAIDATEQVQGLGSLLLSSLKDIAVDQNVRRILTYADRFAIGFFKKHGFAKEITLTSAEYVPIIQHFENADLMECLICK